MLPLPESCFPSACRCCCRLLLPVMEPLSEKILASSSISARYRLLPAPCAAPPAAPGNAVAAALIEVSEDTPPPPAVAVVATDTEGVAPGGAAVGASVVSVPAPIPDPDPAAEAAAAAAAITVFTALIQASLCEREGASRQKPAEYPEAVTTPLTAAAPAPAPAPLAVGEDGGASTPPRLALP